MGGRTLTAPEKPEDLAARLYGDGVSDPLAAMIEAIRADRAQWAAWCEARAVAMDADVDAHVAAREAAKAQGDEVAAERAAAEQERAEGAAVALREAARAMKGEG